MEIYKKSKRKESIKAQFLRLFKSKSKPQKEPARDERKNTGLIDYASWAGLETSNKEYVSLYKEVQNAIELRKSVPVKSKLYK